MIFLNSASSAAALVFYLPGVCTHTDTIEGKQIKARVQNILKNRKMNTIFNEHPVCNIFRILVDDKYIIDGIVLQQSIHSSLSLVKLQYICTFELVFKCEV